MSKKRNVLFITLCLISSLVHAQPISFEQAWQILQAKNNSLAAQRANLSHFEKLHEASKSLNYPSVSLGANYLRLDDDVTLSNEDAFDTLDDNTQSLTTSLLTNASYDYGVNYASILSGSSTLAEKQSLTSSITALWAIYTGGKITAAQHYSEAKKEEAKARLSMESQKRFQDLSRFYYSVVLAQGVVETRRSVEAGLKQHRDFSVKLEQQGQIAKVERLQADAALAKATVERKKSEMNLEIARSALTEVLNQAIDVIPNSQLFINDRLAPLSDFTQQTLDSYPGLAMLMAKKHQAESAINVEKSEYLPKIFLYGNYNVYKDDTLASKTTPDWFVGLGVNITLFDNSGRSEKVEAAESTRLQVRYLYQQAQQDLSVLVKKTYFQAKQAIQEVQGLDSNLVLADENLKLRVKAFNQGLSTSVDVVDAELFLANIQIQQQVAKYNYVIALNNLLSLSSHMSDFIFYQQSAI